MLSLMVNVISTVIEECSGFLTLKYLIFLWEAERQSSFLKVPCNNFSSEFEYLPKIFVLKPCTQILASQIFRQYRRDDLHIEDASIVVRYGFCMLHSARISTVNCGKKLATVCYSFSVSMRFGHSHFQKLCWPVISGKWQGCSRGQGLCGQWKISWHWGWNVFVFCTKCRRFRCQINCWLLWETHFIVFIFLYNTWYSVSVYHSHCWLCCIIQIILL